MLQWRHKEVPRWPKGCPSHRPQAPWSATLPASTTSSAPVPAPRLQAHSLQWFLSESGRTASSVNERRRELLFEDSREAVAYNLQRPRAQGSLPARARALLPDKPSENVEVNVTMRLSNPRSCASTLVGYLARVLPGQQAPQISSHVS